MEPGGSESQREIAISSSGVYLSVADEELANERLRCIVYNTLKFFVENLYLIIILTDSS